LESGKYRDALAFVVEQFDNAANWITTAGTIQKLQELSTSEYMKKVASAAQRVLLHGILAPMQRMENAIHLTEKKMEVGKQKDASAHLRDARSEIPEAKRCVQTFLRMSLGGDAGDVTGLLTRPEEWTDAERVVAAVCENFSHQAQRKGVEFVIRTASIPKLPMREDDFELILANLVHNAVKYGYPNTKIKIQYEVKAPDVCIDVVSYGIPIAQNERERIFDLGYRTLLASRIEYAAAGIGLFAARQAALRWGGRLFVSGSDFEDKSQHGDRYRNTFRFVMKIQEKKP
jgi:signal transduction histidine kinase